MKLIRVTFFVSVLAVLAVLGGCMAVPVNSGYYVESPGYYAPAPAYYAPPIYYGPSIGIGIYGGSRGYGHGGRRGYGHGYGHGGRRGYGHGYGHR